MPRLRVDVGDAAPDFSAPEHAGHTFRLADQRGAPVVLYFYPADFTPVCTREACAFRDEHDAFRNVGARVVGISGDSAGSHASFSRKHSLPFTLLSDDENRIGRLYGVGTDFGFLHGRVTFVIDPQGIVRLRYSARLRGRAHAQRALQAVAALPHTPDDPAASGPR